MSKYLCLLAALVAISAPVDQRSRARRIRAAPTSVASNYYTGTVRTAASCTRTAVNAQYTLAVDRDIIDIPVGDCQTVNSWTSSITITKKVMIRGAGATTSGTRIRSGDAFRIAGNNVRITGIYFDCNYATDGQVGIITAGSLGVAPTLDYDAIRFDHNYFVNCGLAGGNTLDNSAISLLGHITGVIDHNTFENCNGECINICADGVRGLTRPIAYGSSDAMFVENNTWTNNTNVIYENATDGNSAGRVVWRYNTADWTNGAHSGNGWVSNHETCVPCTGDHTAGDAGSLVYEIYENTINVGVGSSVGPISVCRSGACLVYNNYYTYSGSPTGRFSGVVYSNYRSNNYAVSGWCSIAAPQGYSSACHETTGGTAEGLTAAITTLNGAIDAVTTTVVLTSAASLNTSGTADGFAIRIGNETICYTGVSGNTLTGVTRGCYASTTNANPSQAAASHTNGSSVDYLKFGLCRTQINNSYIFNNQGNGAVLAQANGTSVCSTSDPNCDGFVGPDYTYPDIQSFAQRPNNWQYKEGAITGYTAYTYPHPMQSTTGPG